MIAYALAIGIPAAVFIGGCVAISRHRFREDGDPFNWQGTVPAAPGQCSCGAPLACREPAGKAEAAALDVMAGEPDRPVSHDGEETVLERAVRTLPAYVTEAGGHDGDSDAAVASMWNRIQARELNEKLRADAEAGTP